MSLQPVCWSTALPGLIDMRLPQVQRVRELRALVAELEVLLGKIEFRYPVLIEDRSLIARAYAPPRLCRFFPNPKAFASSLRRRA